VSITRIILVVYLIAERNKTFGGSCGTINHSASEKIYILSQLCYFFFFTIGIAKLLFSRAVFFFGNMVVVCLKIFLKNQ